MSPSESRAWLALWALCPPYLVYFALQIISPEWLGSMLSRIVCLAATACVHVAISAIGWCVLTTRERGEDLLADERDRAIEARAIRFAYYLLMVGTVVAGMVLPFSKSGWDIVNRALLAIVLAEALRNLLIVLSYRGSLRFAP
jgi:uncharacterized membrane protein